MFETNEKQSKKTEEEIDLDKENIKEERINLVEEFLCNTEYLLSCTEKENRNALKRDIQDFIDATIENIEKSELLDDSNKKLEALRTKIREKTFID